MVILHGSTLERREDGPAQGAHCTQVFVTAASCGTAGAAELRPRGRPLCAEGAKAEWPRPPRRVPAGASHPACLAGPPSDHQHLLCVYVWQLAPRRQARGALRAPLMTVKKSSQGEKSRRSQSACLPMPDAGCDRRWLFAEGACQPGEGAGTAGGVLLALQPGQSVRADSGLGRQLFPG